MSLNYFNELNLIKIEKNVSRSFFYLIKLSLTVWSWMTLSPWQLPSGTLIPHQVYKSEGFWNSYKTVSIQLRLFSVYDDDDVNVTYIFENRFNIKNIVKLTPDHCRGGLHLRTFMGHSFRA